jgi:hypothetical protein
VALTELASALGTGRGSQSFSFYRGARGKVANGWNSRTVTP